VQPDLAARNFNLSVGLLLVCFQCTWLMLRRVEKGMRKVSQGVGWVFMSFCFASITRIIIILAVPSPSNDFFQSGTYDVIILISYQMLLILLTFNLVLMVNQRLVKDVQIQEVKFNKAFRSSPYAITLTRASDGHILDVNDGFTSITGYSFADVVGKTTRDLNLWTREEDRLAVVSELSSGKRVLAQEYQFRKRSGDEVIGLFSAEIIMIDGLPWILSSISDITERKRAEQRLARYSEHLEEMVAERTRDLQASLEQLVRQERLATLGKLAGSVGHELRNPLTTIANSVYYLKNVQPDASEKVKRHLDLIENETRNSEKIITDLLDFARVKSLERESVSPSDIIHQALEKFPAPPSVDVVQDIPGDLPRMYADPRQMVQVLGNLVVNAHQAMRDGGKLTIRARDANDFIMIEVQDCGEGIPEGNMKMLFEPLFTTKAKGIGLGLSVCKRLVEANDGRIEVQSEVGKGSSFRVYLPINKDI
jgi:PAS domain S-box-containing protein